MKNQTTKASIKAVLSRQDATGQEAVERAIIHIYNRQTSHEQQASYTHVDNQIGFTTSHAKSGSYFARWIKSGNHLSGSHLDKARKMMLRYSRQLLEVAEEKYKSPEAMIARAQKQQCERTQGLRDRISDDRYKARELAFMSDMHDEIKVGRL